MGVQDAVGQGSDLRGLPGAGLLLALRDAALQHRDPHGRRLPRPPGPGAHRALRAARRRRASTDPGLDDHAVDAAVQPRPRRRARHRLRRRRARTASATSSPRRASAHYAAELGEATRVGTRARAPSSSAAATSRCSTFFADTARNRAFQVLGADFVVDRRRHRRRAHGARLRRGRPDAPATPPASRRSCPWTSTAASPPRSRRGPACTSSTPTRASSATSRTRGVVVRHDTYDHSYPHCWRCDQPLVYRAISSWFVEVTAFRDRMVELNQQIKLGARARQGRQLRQVARERPRLVDQPQPLLGLADPGVEAATTRTTRASTSTARSPSSSATSA